MIANEKFPKGWIYSMFFFDHALLTFLVRCGIIGYVKKAVTVMHQAVQRSGILSIVMVENGTAARKIGF